MPSKAEMERTIRDLREENDALRYTVTDEPREAIWLKLKQVTYETGPSLVADVAWAASAVVREGKISREKMVEFLLGRDENGI